MLQRGSPKKSTEGVVNGEEKKAQLGGRKKRAAVAPRRGGRVHVTNKNDQEKRWFLWEGPPTGWIFSKGDGTTYDRS